MNSMHNAPRLGNSNSTYSRRIARLVSCVIALTAAQPLDAALLFDVVYSPGVLGSPKGPGIVSSVSAAASTWSGIFTDPITVKVVVMTDAEAIDVDLGTSPSTIAAALNAFEEHSYASVKAALTSDAKSGKDALAGALLQPGPYLEALTHDTSKSPADLGPGIPSPEMRIGSLALGTTGPKAEAKWNSVLRVPRANSKALGLPITTDGMPDIRLVINDESMPIIDVSRGDGIAPMMFDFQAIAAHELGHGMGFLSGVDEIDYAGIGGSPPAPSPDNPKDLSDDAIFSVLDLFRTNGETRPDMIPLGQPATGFVLDWRFGPPPSPASKPFFSLDPAAILPADKIPYATGAETGDGDQASHWAEMPIAIGVMGPDFDPGMIVDVKPADSLAFDVIGWDPVPEPATLLLAAIAVLPYGRRARQRSSGGTTTAAPGVR